MGVEQRWATHGPNGSNKCFFTGSRFDLFDDVEHLFLFTDAALQVLAAAVGLEIVSLQENLWLGGEVCVFRKPGP